VSWYPGVRPNNLGRFESVYLIRGAANMENYTVKAVWKEDRVINMTIKNTESKRKIKILDSMQFVNGSLRDILVSFKCNLNKGFFPYSYVNKYNLFYIGNKPDIKYFDNIPLDVYEEIPDQWDIKAETLSYLESDIEGLLEFITKFSLTTFKEYSLNITKFTTAPSLAMGIFTSGYYNENNCTIKMIKGQVEEDIRMSYFGGNVDVFTNEINEGYLYDMNSQYPYAMLRDMPVGNPVYSTDKNLDNIFGFVYGKVTAPTAEELRVPFIQYKDPKTDKVTCPRGTFNRMIFSEEIKYAINHGYKFDVKFSYKFARGKGVFDSFSTKEYGIKKSATDPIKRSISKLNLNSVYGKFGAREHDEQLKIFSAERANHIKKNYKNSIFVPLSDNKVLVRYGNRINESLRKLFKVQEDVNKNGRYKMNEIGLSRKRGVISAVQIASAVSSYARISINEFKNIPGNPCIMSVTDSAVLINKLDDSVVSAQALLASQQPELGQMKLEHEIKHGIFIRKKLYALKTSTNKTVIKASGANKQFLTFDNFVELLKGKNVEKVDYRLR
jgi:hypothetical protein